MNSPASDAAENLSNASREAAADFRRRSNRVKDNTNESCKRSLPTSRISSSGSPISLTPTSRGCECSVANALNDMRRVATDTADTLRDRARVAMDATNDYVRDRPWTVVGLPRHWVDRRRRYHGCFAPLMQPA